MSRTKVNLRRIQMALVGLRRLKRKFEAIKARRRRRRRRRGSRGIGKICAQNIAMPVCLASRWNCHPPA